MQDPRQADQIRIDRRFLSRLADEIDGWVDEGIVSLEQGQAIISSYGVSADQSQPLGLAAGR